MLISYVFHTAAVVYKRNVQCGLERQCWVDGTADLKWRQSEGGALHPDWNAAEKRTRLPRDPCRFEQQIDAEEK